MPSGVPRGIYAADMTTRRIPLLACGAVALVLAGCSSDGASTSSSTTRTSSPIVVTTTTVTGSGSGASTSAAGVDSTTSSTAAPGATTSITSTTIKGARVVTNPADNLRIGDTGPGVKQVQEALVAKGFKVVVDSQYGLQTATAVKEFQGKNGLTADGVCGPKTWAKLGDGAAGTVSTTATASTAPTATTAAPAAP